ncbi:unnamed protein product [Colias eurytheme]|nr:unnamed protein product [Colias eurytheme]
MKKNNRNWKILESLKRRESSQVRDEFHQIFEQTMPLTTAERQKRYREKLKNANPEKFQELKLKNNQRSLERYRTKSANLTEEQKEQQRKKWREERKKEHQPSTSQNTAKQSYRPRLKLMRRRIEITNKMEKTEL